MANDRYCFLVLEESLPEGTIAEHRRARRPKRKRSSPARGRMLRLTMARVRYVGWC
jgi:hypothetical protein